MGSNKTKIVFATGNEGKMREIRAIMANADCEVLSQKEAHIAVDVEENGATFEENARIKAAAVAKALKDRGEAAIVLADDSGLEIDCLNKEPGILSARYLGEETPYDIKNAIILERLLGVAWEERTARFVCAIAAMTPEGETLMASGVMEGRIAKEPKGSHGFGYDPIFFLEEYGATAAELTMEQKNVTSHRGKALRAMKEEMKRHGLVSF